MPPGVIEPHTEPVVPQVSCHVRAIFEVPVTLAANVTVWNVSIFITFVVMDTVIGVLDPPPPPPQDAIVMAPATTRMLSRQARLIMELSLQSEVEFTRSIFHSVHPLAEQPSGMTAVATYGLTSLLTPARRF